MADVFAIAIGASWSGPVESERLIWGQTHRPAKHEAHPQGDLYLGNHVLTLAWVTFEVNQWFKSGDSPRVEIWVDPHAPGGVWPLEQGDRLLAAGEYRWGEPPEDPLAWGCGCTQPYAPEAAVRWADAMLAPTATP